MIKPSTVYLNEKFISNDKAAISPNDRGFYFGDGIYEVIKFYRNKPFCFEEHMERLRYNLAEVRISFNETDKLLQVCSALLEANQLKDKYAGVYIQITRGESVRTHRFSSDTVKPTVFARAFTMQSCLGEMIDGAMATTHEDIRWLRCNIKSIGLLPNTLLFEEAATRGAFECILVRNGYVTEATHSNVLAVKEGTVCTHPDSNLILPGITKAAVLKICKELSIPVIEKPIPFEDIYNYDEWFVTGTGSEVVPIVNIDGRVIGNGKPGSVVKKIQQAFYKITYEDLAGETLPLRLH